MSTLYLCKVLFSVDSTYHICGEVDKPNVRIWDSQNLRVVPEIKGAVQRLTFRVGVDGQRRW
jgi:hypothetical protein